MDTPGKEQTRQKMSMFGQSAKAKVPPLSELAEAREKHLQKKKHQEEKAAREKAAAEAEAVLKQEEERQAVRKAEAALAKKEEREAAPAGTDDVQFQCLQDALIREDKDMASTRMGVLEAGNTITVRAFQITRMLTRLGTGD